MCPVRPPRLRLEVHATIHGKADPGDDTARGRAEEGDLARVRFGFGLGFGFGFGFGLGFGFEFGCGFALGLGSG